MRNGKKTARSKALLAGVLVGMFLVSIFAASGEAFGEVERPENSSNSGAVSEGLTSHAPIYIKGNSNFTSANGVVAGNGTKENPYIIEGWEINANSADGILIKDTTAHFVIRKCVIHDGKEGSNYGILLSSVVRGKIENVTVYNNDCGILVSGSSNIISNSYIYNNGWGGILFWGSSTKNNDIRGCRIYNHSNGIHIWDSSNNNNISNCEIYNNGWGIEVCRAWRNNISDCKIYNNSCGINLDYHSEDNIVGTCRVYNNRGQGINFYYSWENIINNCYIYNNSGAGVFFFTHLQEIL